MNEGQDKDAFYYQPPSPAYSESSSAWSSSDSSRSVAEAAAAPADSDPLSVEWESCVDFDSLLIGVEQKLKAPFSSLEFAKTVSSASMSIIPLVKGSRTDHTASSSPLGATYIYLLTKILHRMTKPIQLHLLIALLGCMDLAGHNNRHGPMGSAVMHLLHRAQQQDLDEWVRILAGTIQQLLFFTHDDHHDQREAGLEAHNLWNNAMDSILAQVGQAATQSKQAGTLYYAHPFHLPFYYSLLPYSCIQAVHSDLTDISFNSIKELDTTRMAHFAINTKASALTYDELLEQTKAVEELQLKHPVKNSSSSLDKGKPIQSVSNGATNTMSTAIPLTGVGAKATDGAILGQRAKVGGMNDNIKRRGIAAGTGMMGGMSRSRIMNPTVVAPKQLPQQQSLSSSNNNTTSSRATLPSNTIQTMDSTPALANKEQVQQGSTLEDHEQKKNEKKRKIMEAAAAAGLRKKAWGVAQQQQQQDNNK